MQVSVEATEGLERRLTIAVPGERIEKEVKSRLDSMGSKAKIAGFRPGKVPFKVMQQRYGKRIRMEVLDSMIQESLSEAIVQQKLKLAGRPQISPTKDKPGEAFEYTATFEVYPDIELMGLETIQIERPTADITDDDINNVIESLRKQHCQWSLRDGVSEQGDRLKINFVGTIDQIPFEGGQATDVNVILGSNSMIPGFEDQLLGANTNDTVEFDITFPENYTKNDLAGREAHFSVIVTAIEYPILPEVNDDFAKLLEVNEGTVDGLRNDVHRNMLRELDRAMRAKVKSQIVDALLEKNPIELPKIRVQEESELIAKQMNAQVGMRMQQSQNAGAEEFKPQQFEAEARRRSALVLLFSEIIKKGGLTATAEKVRAEVNNIASSYGDSDQVVSWYYEDKNRLAEVESLVLENQVIDWLLERVEITDTVTTFDKLVRKE